MIVVADVRPINYLVLIGAAHVIEPLYGRLLIPESVALELQAAKTPAVVRTWIAQAPTWCDIRPDPPYEPALSYLDAGERAAITLAILVRANRLLIDEQDGRAAAEQRHLLITGTLGVLADADGVGLLDFETALGQLRRTSFYAAATVVDQVRRRLAGRS